MPLEFLFQNINTIISVASLIVALIVGLGAVIFKPKVSANEELKTINESQVKLTNEQERMKNVYKEEFDDIDRKYKDTKLENKEIILQMRQMELDIQKMNIKIKHLSNIEENYWELIEWARKTWHMFENLKIGMPSLNSRVVHDIKNYKEKE